MIDWSGDPLSLIDPAIHHWLMRWLIRRSIIIFFFWWWIDPVIDQVITPMIDWSGQSLSWHSFGAFYFAMPTWIHTSVDDNDGTPPLLVRQCGHNDPSNKFLDRGGMLGWLRDCSGGTLCGLLVSVLTG
jgi:hypothetical protein